MDEQHDAKFGDVFESVFIDKNVVMVIQKLVDDKLGIDYVVAWLNSPDREVIDHWAMFVDQWVRIDD